LAALRSLRPLAVAAALSIAAPSVARADDPEAARAAYDRGAAAFAAHRYAEAAADLARADALAPNPVALANAIKAAELADDPVLALNLADRAEQRPGAGEGAAAAARRVREKMGQRVGKVSIRCAAARGCVVTVDAEPFPVDQQRWIKAGPHAVEISVGSVVGRYTVTVEAGKTLDWSEPASAAPPSPPPEPKPEPPKPPPPAPPPPRGISPAWFAVGAGLTAVAGGFLVASGVDTLGKHSDYVAFKTSDPGPGQGAQTRTNVLVGVTAALGVATAAIGVFAVRWSVAMGPRAAPNPRAPSSRVARPAAGTLVFTAGPTGAAFAASF
jgi:hypothetical protein